VCFVFVFMCFVFVYVCACLCMCVCMNTYTNEELLFLPILPTLLCTARTPLTKLQGTLELVEQAAERKVGHKSFTDFSKLQTTKSSCTVLHILVV
jgi:hypothetical protein